MGSSEDKGVAASFISSMKGVIVFCKVIHFFIKQNMERITAPHACPGIHKKNLPSYGCTSCLFHGS